MNGTKRKHILGSLLIYIIILTPTTYVLLEWYVYPVLDGMIMTLDYFSSKNQAFILEMTNFNYTVNELKPEFTERFLYVVNDESLSIEESVDILQVDLDNIIETETIKAYKVTLFLFAPILTIPAVVYLHVRFWIWISSLVMKIFKINPNWHDKDKVTNEYKEFFESIYRIFKNEKGEIQKIVTVTKEDRLFKEYNLKEFKDK